MACAAYESPLLVEVDSDYFGSTIAQVVDELVVRTQVGRHATRADVDKAWHYIGKEVGEHWWMGIMFSILWK